MNEPRLAESSLVQVAQLARSISPTQGNAVCQLEAVCRTEAGWSGILRGSMPAIPSGFAPDPGIGHNSHSRVRDTETSTHFIGSKWPAFAIDSRFRAGNMLPVVINYRLTAF